MLLIPPRTRVRRCSSFGDRQVISDTVIGSLGEMQVPCVLVLLGRFPYGWLL